jgi:hypothetical protein
MIYIIVAISLVLILSIGLGHQKSSPVRIPVDGLQRYRRIK